MGSSGIVQVDTLDILVVDNIFDAGLSSNEEGILGRTLPTPVFQELLPHVTATLYQIVEYKQLNLKSVPTDKTCTDILQTWHIPGELTFLKADLKKDTENT